MRFKILACSLMMFVATVAQAGTMTTSMVVSQAFNGVGDPLGAPVVVGGRYQAVPGATSYEVDVIFTAVPTSTEKGWANTLMNFGVANSSGGSNASLDFGADWVANSNTLDTNGAAAGGSAPIYSTNADTGSNTTDL